MADKKETKHETARNEETSRPAVFSKISMFMVVVLIAVLLSLRNPKIEAEGKNNHIPAFLQRQADPSPVEDEGLSYDFYQDSCPEAEDIIRSKMKEFFSNQKGVPANLLRLFFHDCFIQVLVKNDISDPFILRLPLIISCPWILQFCELFKIRVAMLQSKAGPPNLTLKGFHIIQAIKKDLEEACPEVVSCAEVLALATRDGVLLEALSDIPSPNHNISQILSLFQRRGFDERDTVNLLGAHNVGRISCDFIRNRFGNFSGTGHPDSTMASYFMDELRLQCQDGHGITQNLLRSRGLLFADQQLMANNITASLVRTYASDDGTTFRKDFSRAMLKMSNHGVLTGNKVVLIAVLLSLRNPKIEAEGKNNHIPAFLQRLTDPSPVEDEGLSYDFYQDSCSEAEGIIRLKMKKFFSTQKGVPANLLRLFFHDCFIEGCDASVLLNSTDPNNNRSVEKQAPPNLTLKGFDKVEEIKDELEKVCPGVVSCADVLALATRDGILLEALSDIPSPNHNISQILSLFRRRGAHNVGRISCDFIRNRFGNFSGTGHPDITMASDFMDELRLQCQDGHGITQVGAPTLTPAPTPTPTMATLIKGNSKPMMMFSEQLSVAISSGSDFDGHYYQNLLRSRGLLFADQQLMANNITASLVRTYASDDGTTFRKDFARAMLKMSNHGVLTGNNGEVRIKCALPRSHS
ncbi:hypothetical protein Tsubulata_013154 [Turnera subulata]|uniref:peroxidase n=1 Tax=Turnera subulata TaxID=218843 RepID=A0A9Q0J6I2_9ROSI|nr:hypothetical protein Tsubulata_013154 [Turnera subulata]